LRLRRVRPREDLQLQHGGAAAFSVMIGVGETVTSVPSPWHWAPVETDRGAGGDACRC